MAAMSGRRIRVETLAWLAAILPLAAANVAYLIAASQELVPWCFPYLEGCTSVSRAARTGLANTVFRNLMLPYSAVLGLFWWLAALWLRELRPERRRTSQALPLLGLVAAIATAVYSAVLGADGDFYQWMRRYGITFGFAFTVLAEMLLTAAVVGEARLPGALRRAMVGMCALMLLLGLASIPLQYFTSSRSPAMNAVEWIYSVLMVSFFPLVGIAWRRTGFLSRAAA